jgi:hypothetical protein
MEEEGEEGEYLDIPSNFHNEQPIFPYIAFTYWSFYWRCTMLVVRYERNLFYERD